MRAFWLALQFLTCLPVPAQPAPEPPAYGRSVLYYPLIGLLIGTALAGLAVVLAGAPAMLSAALLLGAWVAVTGGLHLDGLADTADAWAGAHGNPARALEIMKDPCSGPAAIVAVMLVLLLKYAALAALVREPVLLLIPPLLGRGAMVALFLTTPYVRPGGLGSLHAKHLSRRAASAVTLGSLIAAVALGGIDGLWAIGAAAIAVLWLRRAARRRQDGITGDTLGAACELVEAVVLVAVALRA